MTVHECYRLSELEEVVGDLRSIENAENGLLIAVIGRLRVQLPGDLEGRLEKMLGKKIGVLRLDGYHVRIVDDRNKRMKMLTGSG